MPRWLPEMATSLALSGLGGRGRFRRYGRFRQDWSAAAPMPSVIFIEPEYTDGPHVAPNDDHPPTGIGKGQALLADLYAILASNSERWRNAMLVIAYDEHGGFFDHVPPLPIAADVGGAPVATTGLRVPAFVVSPHVSPGVPFTDPLDHTSFLQLLADRFDPARTYSPDVAARRTQLGRLSATLTQLPAASLAAPVMAEAAAAALHARNAAAPASSGRADTAAAARTGSAFDHVALKLRADHPELLAGPGWAKLAGYLAQRL